MHELKQPDTQLLNVLLAETKTIGEGNAPALDAGIKCYHPQELPGAFLISLQIREK